MALTCTAASTSQADVQTAVNNCIGTSGATVVIPSGSSTWASSVTISAPPGTSASPFLIQGQTTVTGTPASSATDNTNITCGTSGDNACFAITGMDSTHFLRITGITITFSSNISDGVIQASGAGSTNFTGNVNFRFDHIHFKNGVGGRGISVFGSYGLIDHLLADVTDVTHSDQTITIYGSNIGSDGGFTPWNQALSLGTANAVIIEDTTFNYSNQNEDSIDCYTGARMVVRHSAFNGIAHGCHGTDSGNNRSMFSMEDYSNTYTNNIGSAQRAVTLRGGTAMIYNNTYGGSVGYGNNITPLDYRACHFDQSDTSNWGGATGAQWQLGSIDPSANAGRNNSVASPDWSTGVKSAGTTILPLTNNAGSFSFQTQSGGTSSGSYPATWNQSCGGTTTDGGGVVWTNICGAGTGGVKWCGPTHLDTVCTSNANCTGGDTCSAFFDSGNFAAKGWPTRDQVGRTHDQASAPLYAWNNGSITISPYDGTGTGCNFGTTIATYIAANRDYYDYNASFTGATGTGQGLASARPATCTPFVGYWETDHSQLDVCTSTNTWTSASYTPYTYPDPLQTSNAQSPTCAPGSTTSASTVTETCTNPNTGTTVMCASTTTTPVTNGAGTACTTGTLVTTTFNVSSTSTMQIVAGTSLLPDSAPTSYSITITGGSSGVSGVSGAVILSGGASIK